MTDIPELKFDCGPQGNLTTSVYNETIIKAIYVCGRYKERYGQSQKNGTSNGRNKAINFKGLIVLMVIMLLEVVQAISDVDNVGLQLIDLPDVDGNVYNVTQSDVVDDYFLLRLAGENITAIIDTYTGRYYEVVDTDQAQVEEVNSNSSNIEKRCQIMGPQVSTVREWQTAQSGTWWSPWYPVSCCHYCDKGPSSCSINLGYSFTYGWSVTGGVTLAQLQVSTSFTLTRSYTKDSSFTCNWNGGSGPAQIWYQQQVYWADMQKRDRIFSPGCMQVLPWSKYYRSNVPIKDSYHVGCSVGWGNINCEVLQKCVPNH